ncbi:hypothetical protein HMPREF2860_04580 [Corynebacterium sp. HMSC064E10]|nr:hypothetical protein HMPREF2860_04580 [Corynebacterium sp. HMSC064E10]
MSQRLGTVALELRVSDRGMPDAQQAGSVGFDNAANLFITFDSALHVRLLPEPQPVEAPHNLRVVTRIGQDEFGCVVVVVPIGTKWSITGLRRIVGWKHTRG